MKLALTLALALSAGAAFADPVEGRWRTQPDDNGNSGIVHITACGNAFCGTLVEAWDSNGATMASPNIGRRIVWDMVAEGNGHYDDGQVWAPDRDKTYNAHMDLSGDRLTVAGCVLFICRDSFWTRAN
ncbi:MAG: DUF2147 domain-containing protein [Paracoccaceae bacterium]